MGRARQQGWWALRARAALRGGSCANIRSRARVCTRYQLRPQTVSVTSLPAASADGKSGVLQGAGGCQYTVCEAGLSCVRVLFALRVRWRWGAAVSGKQTCRNALIDPQFKFDHVLSEGASQEEVYNVRSVHCTLLPLRACCLPTACTTHPLAGSSCGCAASGIGGLQWHHHVLWPNRRAAFHVHVVVHQQLPPHNQAKPILGSNHAVTYRRWQDVHHVGRPAIIRTAWPGASCVVRTVCGAQSPPRHHRRTGKRCVSF
jgi:hypothetical protein